VVDMGLPDRKGDVLMREIRAIYPSLPIVIASGRGEEDLRFLLKELPLTRTVSKPYTAEGLMAALRAVGIARPKQ
jgi:DNA-binding response OmpR family regulator